MENKNIVSNYLRQQNNDLETNSNSNGIMISLNNNEVVIKGSKLDLIKLSDLLVDVALSDVSGSHVHIDDLTLLDNNSNIKSIIIERE